MREGRFAWFWIDAVVRSRRALARSSVRVFDQLVNDYESQIRSDAWVGVWEEELRMYGELRSDDRTCVCGSATNLLASGMKGSGCSTKATRPPEWPKAVAISFQRNSGELTGTSTTSRAGSAHQA